MWCYVLAWAAVSDKSTNLWLGIQRPPRIPSSRRLQCRLSPEALHDPVEDILSCKTSVIGHHFIAPFAGVHTNCSLATQRSNWMKRRGRCCARIRASCNPCDAPGSGQHARPSCGTDCRRRDTETYGWQIAHDGQITPLVASLTLRCGESSTLLRGSVTLKETGK
jgi:hypothetical protein